MSGYRGRGRGTRGGSRGGGYQGRDVILELPDYDTWKTDCGHSWCEEILAEKIRLRRRKRGGAGVLCLISDPNRELHVLLGQNASTKEGKEDQFGKWAIVTGGSEPQDQFCFVRTALRELREEFKLEIPDTLIKGYVEFQGTPVFVARLPEVQAIQTALDNVEEAYNDPNLDSTLKEMRTLATVPLGFFSRPRKVVRASDLLPIPPDGDLEVTTYTQGVLQELIQNIRKFL